MSRQSLLRIVRQPTLSKVDQVVPVLLAGLGFLAKVVVIRWPGEAGLLGRIYGGVVSVVSRGRLRCVLFVMVVHNVLL